MNLVSAAHIERLVDKVFQKRGMYGIEPIAVEFLNNKYVLYARLDSWLDCIISVAVKGDTNNIDDWKILRTVKADNPEDVAESLNKTIILEENFIDFDIDDLWFV